VQPATTPLVQATLPRAPKSSVHNIQLAEAAAPAEDSLTATDKPARIGFARTLPALLTAHAVSDNLAWRTLSNGHRVAALSVTSPGAKGVRLGVRPGPLPEGTVLRFYAPNEAALEYPAAEIEDILARNVYFGEEGPEAHVFWSPVVDAETIVVEVDLPPDALPSDVRIALPQLSHLTVPAHGAVPADACNADAACRALGRESNAVARVVFTDHGDTYACAGALVADRDPASFVPYFLTARHCVDSQTVASTVQVYWFYRAAACAGGTAAGFQTRARGAMLLRVVPATDTALLRLNAAPPPGATYAGWVIGDAAGALREARWDDASTPIQASGDCGTSTLAYYGGFDASYNAGLYQWLGGVPQPAASR
jgi:hypothetical protein